MAPRALPLAFAAALIGVGLGPLTASANGGLWQCDESVWQIIDYIRNNAVETVMFIINEYLRAIGKVKCTALETLDICADERVGLPQSDATLYGVPLSTGRDHTHRSLCKEYFFGQTGVCPTGRVKVITHRQEAPTPYDPGFHTHSESCM